MSGLFHCHCDTVVLAPSDVARIKPKAITNRLHCSLDVHSVTYGIWRTCHVRHESDLRRRSLLKHIFFGTALFLLPASFCKGLLYLFLGAICVDGSVHGECTELHPKSRWIIASLPLRALVYSQRVFRRVRSFH